MRWRGCDLQLVLIIVLAGTLFGGCLAIWLQCVLLLPVHEARCFNLTYVAHVNGSCASVFCLVLVADPGDDESHSWAAEISLAQACEPIAAAVGGVQRWASEQRAYWAAQVPPTNDSVACYWWTPRDCAGLVTAGVAFRPPSSPSSVAFAQGVMIFATVVFAATLCILGYLCYVTLRHDVRARLADEDAAKGPLFALLLGLQPRLGRGSALYRSMRASPLYSAKPLRLVAELLDGEPRPHRQPAILASPPPPSPHLLFIEQGVVFHSD